MQLRDLQADKEEAKEAKIEDCKILAYVLLESKFLGGERLILSFEKKLLEKLQAEFPDIVIYFPPEINELYKHKGDKEFIKKIHLTKKKFKGWVVPSANKG